jgi:hypothetical protein
MGIKGLPIAPAVKTLKRNQCLLLGKTAGRPRPLGTVKSGELKEDVV